MADRDWTSKGRTHERLREIPQASAGMEAEGIEPSSE